MLVGRDGFEPSKEYSNRFTVCPIWPLWNHPLFPKWTAKIVGLILITNFFSDFYQIFIRHHPVQIGAIFLKFIIGLV